MRQYIRSTRATLTTALSAAALVALAACGGRKDDTGALASDSALGRDLATAQPDSVQPQLQDVPATPAPAAGPAPAPKPAPRPKAVPAPAPKPAAPTPAPAAAVPVSGTVAAGTRLAFANGAKVCSNTVAVGDTFTAELSSPVSATNGISIPAGATGTFEVTEATTAQRSTDNTTLAVRLESVQFGGRTYPVQSTIETASTERVRSASKGTDAKKVVGGAIIGAIAGQVIGKNTKGTVIGAAAGAAAGSAAAAATANYDTCINGGATIAAVLDAPVTVRPAPVP
ncbi:hypothetical protein [Gemmatimonas sp.]|uniref:hypothetical protein n=1 Tax=Gemmatimonas sp. TaxID=1962908 RepID=UPI0027BA5FEA|nr:hypothetical protein [Gemmatimonas sp.]